MRTRNENRECRKSAGAAGGFSSWIINPNCATSSCFTIPGPRKLCSSQATRILGARWFGRLAQSNHCPSAFHVLQKRGQSAVTQRCDSVTDRRTKLLKPF